MGVPACVIGDGAAESPPPGTAAAADGWAGGRPCMSRKEERCDRLREACSTECSASAERAKLTPREEGCGGRHGGEGGQIHGPSISTHLTSQHFSRAADAALGGRRGRARPAARGPPVLVSARSSVQG